MSHYTQSYAGLSRKEADDRAIEDAKDYLSDRQWQTVLALCEGGSIGALDFGLSIAGVRGYPFHAIARRYCLAAYREWMHSGDDAVLTDDEGFALPEAS